MLRLTDDTLVLSASDVTDFLACGHLAAQKLALARGERNRPRQEEDPHLEFLRRRGDSHEAAQLARLSAEGGGHVDLTREVRPWVREELEAAARDTAAAIDERTPLIYQPTFFDGRWQGRADFLRLDPAAGLYEVLDTKLARTVKPGVVHQLSLYSRLLAQLQGAQPALAHVVLGDGRQEAIELRRYAALHRSVVRRVEQLADAATPVTEPEPVAHCAVCTLARECRAPGWSTPTT